jgi:hypothetical protein
MTDQEIDDIWSKESGEDCIPSIAHRFARALISRAIPDGHVVVPGWLPIESAPKDGTEIIAAQHGTPERGVIFWDEVMRNWCSPGEDWSPPNWKPTHWMPLPAAPANKEGS